MTRYRDLPVWRRWGAEFLLLWHWWVPGGGATAAFYVVVLR